MDASQLGSMTAEIVNGIAKENSRFKDEPDFDTSWDEMVTEIAKIRQSNPNAVIEIPGE